jgi:hypothetical protein
MVITMDIARKIRFKETSRVGWWNAIKEYLDEVWLVVFGSELLSLPDQTFSYRVGVKDHVVGHHAGDHPGVESALVVELFEGA